MHSKISFFLVLSTFFKLFRGSCFSKRSMELTRHSSPLFLLILGLLLPAMVSSIGINYGQIANNLPTPENVIPLLKSISVTKVKLYDADPKVLRAFANTGVEFVVGLGNNLLEKVKDPQQAEEWIKENVKPFLPATKITCITVGNEILSLNDTALTTNLYPAMQGVHTALVNLGLDKQVSVTTAHSLAVLETSFPPSAGAFRSDLTEVISQIVSFHAKTGSSILINAYPFFAYKEDPKQIPLDYVLFQPNHGSLDPATNLRYENMLFAQIDAVHSALASLGFRNVSVQISETGWPSKGDEDEFGATPDNAKKYNGNLMKLVSQNKGTPMRPDSELDVYVFALFNENMKPGPTSERNYGLFKPDGSPAYMLGVAGNNTSGGGDDSDPPSPNIASTGYLSISAATEKLRMCGGIMLSLYLSWCVLPF